MVAIIGGDPVHFRPLVDLYREAGQKAGHSLDRLTVGVHAIGYVAETNEKAASDFSPGYLRSFNAVGKERGWGPTTMAHFNASSSPRGALLVGDPNTVAKKIVQYDTTLGGISRITFQMSVAGLPHEHALKAIELVGSEVMPLVAEGLRKG
jgi:alkanesulfonate monooxygenase SsuD/methylene tetrahydromethanopterin reductase-like flavin-dependent oxidoreductase (luciferase family)